MMSPDLAERHLIVRETFDAAALVGAHPPRFTHPNKRLVHGMASPPRGALVYSRWRAMPLPTEVPATVPAHEMREDVFGYEPASAGAFEWYLNFADPHLFVAYGGPLLAQDELQVLEHPALGSLCEALRASNDPRLRPVTVEDGVSTPVLVRGVERRSALATDPDLLEGRPLGLYGNRFARAKEDSIRRALTVLDPPTTFNILAMSAPPGGTGRYTEAEIGDILVTAYTGFRAARLEAEIAAGATAVVVHTGTGAPGKHLVLDGALFQVVEDLVGSDAAWAGRRERIVEAVGVEVGQPPEADEPLLPELLEGGEGVAERVRAGPVEEVEVDRIDSQATQAALARCNGPTSARVVREHLGDQEHLGAPAGDGLAHDLLDLAVAVHLGGTSSNDPLGSLNRATTKKAWPGGSPRRYRSFAPG
jgi:hypothetical protein